MSLYYILIICPFYSVSAPTTKRLARLTNTQMTHLPQAALEYLVRARIDVTYDGEATVDLT
jgi:hypothetical protein